MVPIICKMTQAVEIKVKMPICGKETPVMNMAVYLWQWNGVLGWLTCTCYQSNYCRYYRGYLRRVSLSSLSLGSVTFSYWFKTVRPHSFPEITATALIQVNTVCSGRASFQGDAYTVHKWTRNLCTEIWKCVPTKRDRETNNALLKHLYPWVHQTIQRNKMLFMNDAHHPFTTLVSSVIVCIMCSSKHLQTKCRTSLFHDLLFGRRHSIHALFFLLRRPCGFGEEAIDVRQR